MMFPLRPFETHALRPAFVILAATLAAGDPARGAVPAIGPETDNGGLSIEDRERSWSRDRGLAPEVVAAAPQFVFAQLEESRARHQTPEEWRGRRARLREEFLRGAQLWPLPARTPLDPIRHSLRRHDGYTVESVAIESMPGFFATGTLYRPSGVVARGPAILSPHGHFQPLGRFRAEQQIRAAHLARMGATVLSLGMVGYQDSRQTAHSDPLVLALQVWNAIRATDFLAGLPEVDPARIGATGASGGGSQALFLAMLDERIAAVCPVGIVYPWTSPLGCLCESGLPVMEAAGTNAIELAAAVAPRPQLLISIGGDATRDFPETGFPFIRGVYALHGRGGAVENVHLPDEFHDYGPSKRRAVYAFLARHLGLRPREEDAATIVIESPGEMDVFGPGHPLPPHALHGSEAVGRAFRALARPAEAGR